MTVTNLVTWTSAGMVPLTCEQKAALSGGPPARPLLWVGGPLGGSAEAPPWLRSATRTEAHGQSSVESALERVENGGEDRAPDDILAESPSVGKNDHRRSAAREARRGPAHRDPGSHPLAASALRRMWRQGS